MIIDSLSNLANYETLNPLFAKAINHIKTINFEEPSLGKIELDGLTLFITISKNELKQASEAFLEAHNEYIDIQFPISGAETMGWSPRESMKEEVAPFDAKKDIQFFKDQSTTQFILHPGQFVMFFPQDAHAPCIGEGQIVKAVIKVKINSDN